MKDLNAKEKAKELINKMDLEYGTDAEQCALIAVDEVITALDFNQWQNAKIINYYLEVREEIEKLQ